MRVIFPFTFVLLLLMFCVSCSGQAGSDKPTSPPPSTDSPSNPFVNQPYDKDIKAFKESDGEWESKDVWTFIVASLGLFVSLGVGAATYNISKNIKKQGETQALMKLYSEFQDYYRRG
jgi:hypothetical protein